MPDKSNAYLYRNPKALTGRYFINGRSIIAKEYTGNYDVLISASTLNNSFIGNPLSLLITTKRLMQEQNRLAAQRTGRNRIAQWRLAAAASSEKFFDTLLKLGVINKDKHPAKVITAKQLLEATKYALEFQLGKHKGETCGLLFRPGQYTTVFGNAFDNNNYSELIVERWLIAWIKALGNPAIVADKEAEELPYKTWAENMISSIHCNCEELKDVDIPFMGTQGTTERAEEQELPFIDDCRPHKEPMRFLKSCKRALLTPPKKPVTIEGSADSIEVVAEPVVEALPCCSDTSSVGGVGHVNAFEDSKTCTDALFEQHGVYRTRHNITGIATLQYRLKFTDISEQALEGYVKIISDTCPKGANMYDIFVDTVGDLIVCTTVEVLDDISAAKGWMPEKLMRVGKDVDMIYQSILDIHDTLSRTMSVLQS